MSTITIPEYLPATGLIEIPGINFKTVANHTVSLPDNRRYALVTASFVSTSVSALTGGASVTVLAVDLGDTTEATLTTALTGANNDIKLTSKVLGAAGNDITLTLVDPAGNDQALAVTVTGTDISVSLATGGAGAITTTATQLVAALTASAPALALVTPALAPANSGAGVVTALTETALSGGLDYVVKGTMLASTDLADTDATHTVQNVTNTSGYTAIGGEDTLMVSITTGATATTDVKDVLLHVLAY